jgi:hypothetical protein
MGQKKVAQYCSETTGRFTEFSCQWEVVGPHDALVLELGSVNNTADVTGKTEYTVSPNKETKYTLVAYYNDGQTVIKKTTVTIGDTGKEQLIYNWQGTVEQDTKGFPMYEPPTYEIVDWTSPINFAEGTLYFYVKIIEMPAEPKEMKLEYCFWQDGFDKGAEQCAAKGSLTGDPGTVLTWSDDVQGMWSKPERPLIDWTRERRRESYVIKTKDGDPVSSWTEPIWGGDDPKEWYPFEWHAMAVIVEPGKAFSGWDTYVDDPPIPTPTPEP